METIFSALFHLFFPERCPACGRELAERSGHWMCLICRYDLPTTGYTGAHDNPVFKKFGGLIPVAEASAYFFFTRRSRYREMIHGFKYRGWWRLGSRLGEMMGEALRTGGLYRDVEVVIPVPLHRRRHLTRGYNQAEYLARSVASRLGVPVETRCLRRRIYNPAQATTRDRNDRWENVRDIFAVRHPERLAGRHILLVDDVLTTGATIVSCAEALLAQIPDLRISIATLAVSAHELFGRHKQGGL